MFLAILSRMTALSPYQNRESDVLCRQFLGSLQHLQVNALGKDHTLRVGFRLVGHQAHQPVVVADTMLQPFPVSLPVLDGLAGDTGLDSRLWQRQEQRN